MITSRIKIKLILCLAAAAEAAHLCVWTYDDLKKEKKPAPEINVLTQFADSPDRYEGVAGQHLS